MFCKFINIVRLHGTTLVSVCLFGFTLELIVKRP